MIIDSYKIGEYLRVYSQLFSMSLVNNKSLYDNYKQMIDDKKTTLSLDEYNNMILVKNYYSASMTLFSSKDTFQKGLNDVDIDNKELFINDKLPLNKKCLENFNDKDIIIYIRNAIAHSGSGLTSIYVDEDNLRIKVKLENTIASKGVNKGNNVPFEVEFDTEDLIMMSAFCCYSSKTANESGVDYDQNAVNKSTSTNILSLLDDVIDTTYYQYTLFKTISDSDKEKLYNEHSLGNDSRNFDSFDKMKTKFIRKDERVDLSDDQKNCIFNGIKYRIDDTLESYNLTPLILSLHKKSDDVKKILSNFLKRYFEYEALKVIPLGREKYNIHLVSILLNSFDKSNNTVFERIFYLLDDFKNKGETFSLFKLFNIEDNEEIEMFINTIGDVSYIEHEVKSLYYTYIFENIIKDDEIISIGDKQLDANRIRNAFTHGRWYFDEELNNWCLFDNKDSLKKADQYKFDWSESISDEELDSFVNKRYLETIKNRSK